MDAPLGVGRISVEYIINFLLMCALPNDSLGLELIMADVVEVWSSVKRTVRALL